MFTDAQPTPEKLIPEEFYTQVKQVLENFYDFPFLNNHPLANAIVINRLRPTETNGQRLRRIFLMAIDELKPGNEAASRTMFARYHSLITLRYVEAGTMQHVAHELGISERQAYRDLKRAEESLTALIWTRVDPVFYLRSVETGGEEAEKKAEEIDLHFHPTHIQELLHNAGHAVERLADQQSARIIFDIPDDPLYFFTDPIFSQQVLINLLSNILQNAQSSKISIWLEKAASSSGVVLHFEVDGSLDCEVFKSSPTNKFIQQLGWQLKIVCKEEHHRWDIRLITGDEGIILLVIDDHPPLIELLRRYLTNTPCQVVGVSDAHEGLRLAHSLKPGAILLDVMMPDIDGWEVLQRLRNSPQTASIPVVVCSIFNDPKLAFSLGASAALPKPVRRDQLFEVLKQMHILP